MRVVVPLAGPDFILDCGNLKAEIDFDGEPLLRRVLRSRPWASAVQDYSFVLMDTPETRAFATSALAEWFPDASVTFISHYTRGAALSALAGMATGADVGAPIIVDLADILYTSTLNPATVFYTSPECGAIALTFKSDNPSYSYLRLDALGGFAQAAEKQLIADNASAGTYMFRDMATYLRALAHGLENEVSQTFCGLFYVCPLFNGVKIQGKGVMLETVNEVIDIKVGIH